MASFAFADGIPVITQAPAYHNPANPLNIIFTFSDPAFDSNSPSYSFVFAVGETSTYDGNGSSLDLSAFSALQCTGTIATGAECQKTLTLPPHADANMYLFVVAQQDGGLSGQFPSAGKRIAYDSTNPVIMLGYSPSPTSGWSEQPVTVTGSCTDASPCTLQYRVGTGAFLPFSGSKLFDNVDANIEIRGIDDANNVGNAITSRLQIDTTAPVVGTVTFPSDWITDSTPEIVINATDAGIGGMKAYYKCSGGTELNKSFSGNSVSITDFDITANGCPASGERTILYHVTDGLNHASAEASFVIKYDATPPGAPSSLSHADVTETQVNLTWNAPSDSGGSGIDEYEVFRATSNSIPSGALATNSDTSYTATGLTCNTTYFFWVKAKDNAGNLGPESSSHEVRTHDCPGSSSTSGSSSSSSSSSGGGGGGGGGGGVTCVATLTVPQNIYAGDTINLTASGNNYAGGKITAVYPISSAANTTIEIGKKATSATSWEGTFAVPNKVGTSVTFRFRADSCSPPQATIRVIKDPSARATETPTTAPSTPAPANENSGSPSNETTATPSETVAPAAQTSVAALAETIVDVSPEKLAALLTFAGFNAENAETNSEMEQAIGSWKLVKSLSVVPAKEDGKYSIRLTLHLTNAPNKGVLKVVESIPKTFAESASQIASSMKMTVLQDDPLVQFELSDLTEGQAIEIQLTSSKTYRSVDVATEAMNLMKGEMTTPPLLFSSGTAKPGEGNVLGGITGLASGAVANAPIALGFLAVIGLIFLSVRVVRGSVEGTDNPILRSSSRAGLSNSAPRRATSPVRGTKLWSSNLRDYDE